MYSCLERVRSNIQETSLQLLKSIPTLRIAIVAHGDYCKSVFVVVVVVEWAEHASRRLPQLCHQKLGFHT